MGDFLLDFRARDQRCEEAEQLRFLPDMRIDCLVRDPFSLFLSRLGNDDLWSPFEASDGLMVAVSGRIALEDTQWEKGSRLGPRAGLACRAIAGAYREHGLEALTRLSGAFTLHIHDPERRAYHLVSDCAGACPCYSVDGVAPLLSSHPDLLALAAGRHGDLDLTSLAQFIATGVVSFPFSYYRGITSLEFASVHTFDLSHAGSVTRSSRRYAAREPDRLREASEKTLAHEVADALSRSSRRCTNPLLGSTALALSGGLDSRAILCSGVRHSKLVAFCAFDEKNDEYRYASAIAEALGVPFLPLQRSLDHYGDSAELGVRISGGMGEFTSNHFLGFRARLMECDITNLVTGCYFDYLFKSLALDTSEGGLLRQERLGPFSYQSYLPHFLGTAKLASAVIERLDALYPPQDRMLASPLARARVATRRIFPLYHEGDNAQRLVPLRVMNWFPPAVDPLLVELSIGMPPAAKLNRAVFRKAVVELCGETIVRIPDGNTGAPLTASPLRVGINRYRIALRRRIERRRARLASNESWPNWHYYLRSSARIRELWVRPNELARDLITELSGSPFKLEPGAYLGRATQYFARLLTLKIWLDQRVGSAPGPVG